MAQPKLAPQRLQVLMGSPPVDEYAAHLNGMGQKIQQTAFIMPTAMGYCL
jgi:hypothetical protein